MQALPTAQRSARAASLRPVPPPRAMAPTTRPASLENSPWAWHALGTQPQFVEFGRIEGVLIRFDRCASRARLTPP
eukprot:scaffold16867_cov67-Phaeocystis_antarctica.AAC.5